MTSGQGVDWLVGKPDIVRLDETAGLRDRRDVFDHVTKLGDVALPRSLAKTVESRVGELRRWTIQLAVTRPVLGQEVVRENRHILGPVSEWREGDRYNSQAIVQAFPQQSCSDSLAHISATRSDQARVVSRSLVMTAKPANLCALERFEESLL